MRHRVHTQTRAQNFTMWLNTQKVLDKQLNNKPK